MVHGSDLTVSTGFHTVGFIEPKKALISWEHSDAWWIREIEIRGVEGPDNIFLDTSSNSQFYVDKYGYVVVDYQEQYWGAYY